MPMLCNAATKEEQTFVHHPATCKRFPCDRTHQQSTIMKWVTPSNHSMSRAYQFNAWPEWSENLCQPSRILTNELIYSCSPQPAIQLNRKEEYSVLEYCYPPWRLFKKIPFPRFDKLTLSTRKTEFILLLWWDIYYTIPFSTDDRSSCRND